MISFLRQNLFWMLLSVLLSIGLWLIVTVQQNPRESNWFTSVPVEVLNVPTNLTLRTTPDPVRVLVSAPQDVWRSGALGQDKIRATADASAASAGLDQLTVHVTISDPRATVETVDPQRIDVQLEALKQKDVPVQLLTNGNIPTGFELKSAETTPKTVTVAGPQSVVDQVTFVQAIVNVEGARTSLSQPFPISPMSDTGPVTSDRLTLMPAQVQVDVSILPAPTYKALPVAPQITGQVATGYEIVGLLADPSTITVTGSPDALRNLTTLQTTPVNVANATSDLVLNAEPDLPAGVTLARPQQIVVRVLVDQIQGSKIIEVAPTIKHRLDQSVTISPGSADVTIVGPMPILATIGPSDVQLEIDVTSLAPGRYYLKPIISTPPLVRADYVTPSTFTVDVS